MLKHSRKFKLVPVSEEGEENGRETDYAPPTPPVLKKLSHLDQELRATLEDATLSEAEKMQRYESTLMKWGKFYRQYQSTEGSGRDNTSWNATAPTPSTWHSTPKTLLFAPSPPLAARDRSRSPYQRPPPSSPLSPSSPPLSPPPPLLLDSPTYATPATSPKKWKKRKPKKEIRPMTPAQAIRHSQRLKARSDPYQVGSSWLPWRLNAPKRRRRR